MTVDAAVDAFFGPAARQPGIQAVASADRSRMAIAKPRRWSGSVDVDTRMRSEYPNDPRWDYLILVQDGQRVLSVWLEVHPASGDHNATEVGAKLDWLNRLMTESTLAACPKLIVWVATGAISFNARSPKIRSLAARGCRFAGKFLNL